MGNVKRLPKRGKYKQTTEHGLEIPIPKRGDVLKDLTKVAKPPPKEEPKPDEG
jgi:hypothetical protein